jgi:hypothetical protein
MEPIFARLGVLHQSRNFGNGGLGTAHNGIAAGSTYGPDVDLLMWDSGMTEGRDAHVLDMFARQVRQKFCCCWSFCIFVKNKVTRFVWWRVKTLQRLFNTLHFPNI